MRLSLAVGHTAIVVATTALAGCMPLISHGPSVERGFRMSGTQMFAVTTVRSLADSSSDLRAIPSFSFRGSMGFRSQVNADEAALELGLEASIFNGALLDVYVQAPPKWTGSLDAGVGIAGAAGIYSGPLAYTQFGRWLGERYIFTTQIVSVARHSFDAGIPIRWQPIIAIQSFDGPRSWFFFLGGSIGPAYARCERRPCESTIAVPPPAQVVVGMTTSMRP